MRSPHSAAGDPGTPAGTRSGKRRLELLLEARLREGPDDLLRDLAVLEEDQRRDRHDPVLRSGLGVLVDVHLHDGQVVALVVELLQMRSDDAAGPAPGRPEVDQHGLAGLEYLGGEVVVGYFGQVAGHRVLPIGTISCLLKISITPDVVAPGPSRRLRAQFARSSWILLPAGPGKRSGSRRLGSPP